MPSGVCVLTNPAKIPIQLDRWSSEEYDLLPYGFVVRARHHRIGYYLERKLAGARTTPVWLYADTRLWSSLCRPVLPRCVDTAAQVLTTFILCRSCCLVLQLATRVSEYISEQGIPRLESRLTCCLLFSDTVRIAGGTKKAIVNGAM